MRISLAVCHRVQEAFELRRLENVVNMHLQRIIVWIYSPYIIIGIIFDETLHELLLLLLLGSFCQNQKCLFF